MCTTVDRSHVERRPSRRGVYPIDYPAHDRALVLRIFFTIGQTMREHIDIVRRGREVHEPREQRALGRSYLRGGPCPRSGGVRYSIFRVGDDDRGGRVARGGSQPDDVRERVADRLKARIDGGRPRAARYARELAAQRSTYEVAHRLGGELGLGEEVAELGQRALRIERSFGYVFAPRVRGHQGRRTSGVMSPPGTTPASRSVRPAS